MTDPVARKLYHRVILQSGSFGRPPLSRHEAAEIGAQYVWLLGIDPESADAGARMRAVPVADLIAASGVLARARARFADTTPSFMPHVEMATDQAGLIDTIAEAARGLDVLIGTTREEVHAFYAANPAMASPPDDAVRGRFADLAGSADAIETYRQRRPGGSVMDLLADLGTEHTFVRPSLRLAEAIAAHGGRVHAYQFDWAPPRSPFRACHCIELPFMFGTLDAWPDAAMLAGGDAAQMADLSRTMRAPWGRFVRDGADALDWPCYDAERRTTMIYGDICGPVGDPAGIESWV
jgi:para-nitrobenzyl esterase